MRNRLNVMVASIIERRLSWLLSTHELDLGRAVALASMLLLAQVGGCGDASQSHSDCDEAADCARNVDEPTAQISASRPARELCVGDWESKQILVFDPMKNGPEPVRRLGSNLSRIQGT